MILLTLAASAAFISVLTRLETLCRCYFITPRFPIAVGRGAKDGFRVWTWGQQHQVVGRNRNIFSNGFNRGMQQSGDRGGLGGRNDHGPPG